VSSDLIVVMKEGAIIEEGNHAELMAMKGFYYSLFNAQFS
jgi:ATP-binding cassette subfamily B protein